MAKTYKHLVGIDFSTRIIRAVEMTRMGKKKVLSRYHEILLPAGAIENDVIHDVTLVKKALQQLWRDARFSTKRVVFGLGGQQVLVREITMPYMKPEHIREALPYHVADMLPIPAAEAVLSFYPVDLIEKEGQQAYRGLMIATARTTVNQYADLLRSAGLKLIDVDFASFALMRAVNPATYATGVHLLADVRADNTSLIITADGVPQFIRHLSTGGSALTTHQPAIATIPADAGAADGDSDTAMIPAATTLVVNQEQVSQLTLDIRQTIAFWQMRHPETQISNIVLFSDAENVDSLDMSLRLATSLPVRFGVSDGPFTLGKEIREEEFLTTGSELAVAIGLTLRN